jgi:hypothetical protein
VIVTSSKPYGIVRGTLKKWKTIGIVSCNSCARVCETGGKEPMEKLAERLKQDGFEVAAMELVPMACNMDSGKRSEFKGDYIVMQACDSGVMTFQTIFPNKVVVPALDTLGIGARDGQGNIFMMRKF